MDNMSEMMEIIKRARQAGASDIHIAEGMRVVFRINGAMQRVDMPYCPEQMGGVIMSLMNAEQTQKYKSGSDVDFAVETAEGDRQRVNVFRERGKIAASIRLLNNRIPSLEELGLPEVLKQWTDVTRGLVLVTGPTGSGKSTTLASMMEYINQRKTEHIITVEDPIEYVYPDGKSLIHQREVGRDVSSFAAALRSALREDPDIILVGEMRDFETVSAALTAAETGHLVLSTLHTTGAAQTVDRIIDACPEGSQNQVRTQLSAVLCGVVTQCLIPTADRAGRVAATEILCGTDAVANTIRENKCHQLPTLIQSGLALGMHTLNKNLSELYESGRISRENAFRYSNDKRDLEQYIRG